jgi:hypothetical protein
MYGLIGRRPLIAGFAQQVELDPVGGHGLPGPTTG